MFKIILALLFNTIFLHLFSASTFEEEVHAYLSKKDFQGVVLIAKKGEILLCKGYGPANIEHGIPNTPKTVFRVGSITKQFTAVAILQLQEKGMLNVQDPIGRYLPDYPNGEAITIHHLLTHSSGIPSITSFPQLSEIQRHPTTVRRTMTYFQELPLEFEPGSDCKYSDSGYIVLGAIIEAVAKRPYEEYLMEFILGPLQLNSTYFDHNQNIIVNRASGYSQNDKGELVNAEFVEMSFPHGAGSLASTVEDLYRWDLSLKAQALLSPKSSELLFFPHATSRKNNIAYGYGFFIDEKKQIIGHMGSIEGFRAALYRQLKEDLTVIVLTNNEKISALDLQEELAAFTLSFWRP